MKKQLFTLCVALSILITSTMTAEAQQADTIQNQRLTKLENILSKLPKVSGVINFRYRLDEDRSTFDIRRARLDVKGDISKMFDYRVQVEFASGPRLLDAQIRAKIKPYFNVQIGQFKVPFSLENPYSPTGLECIDNAMAITKLVGYSDVSGISANGRDIGVMIYGEVFKKEGYSIIDYSIGVFNGAGINTTDNNKSKDVIARVNVNPIKTVTLSASGYLGEAYLNDSTRHATRDRLGFGIRYDDKKWMFRSEYLYGMTHKTESMGAYAVLAYTFFKKLQPVIRFDYFQEDIYKASTGEIDYMAGVNYWFIPQKVGLQLNFTYRTFNDTKRNTGNICIMGTAAF
ncbi:porin [Bacteroides sp. UBA939]|uniref:porin n=1 Tax=Bacteroides sp. UBA939 TaxID=1946092 RepID=UPI0025BA6DB7|nr:porin [Bacteroides sp. UBA939]